MTSSLPEREDTLLLDLADLISLEDTQIPGRVSALRHLSQANLEQLQQSDPESWPPILVTQRSSGYLVIDGYHRWEIAKRKQLGTLQATCKAYHDENAIIEAAFRANLFHGLRTSVETKGEYAYWLHVTYPEMQQLEIAQRVGMTQGAVSKAIARRDNETRNILPQSDTIDPEKQKKQIKKSCRRFTHIATLFLDEAQQLDDPELREILNSILKKEDKIKLARLGRLLMNDDALSQWFSKK